MVKLVLNPNEFPAALETPLKDVLNLKNPKLKITSVEYADISTEYKLKQKKSGVIIDQNSTNKQVLAYVFFSPDSEDSGNTFVAQTIFPDLIDCMEGYLKSPSFTPVNHPVYFINMVDQNIRRLSIKRDLACLSASGIHYLELYNYQNINTDNIPQELEVFHQTFVTDLGLTEKYYSYDTSEKSLSILFPINELLNGSGNDFNGSNEKFYWTEVLTISIIAIKSGYNLDLQDIQNFITNYESRFSSDSKKMKRCKILLEYLKKLKYKKHYHEL